MKVRFYTYEYPNKFEMVELNKEGVAYMQEVADKYSEDTRIMLYLLTMMNIEYIFI